MSTSIPYNEEAYASHHIRLDVQMAAYVEVLTKKAAGPVSFRTGSGRIFQDLLIFWPAIEEWEEKAQELCERITDAVYPLVGELMAQGVEITAVISAKPIHAPNHVDGLMTCIIFDCDKKLEHICCLSPDNPLEDTEEWGAQKGVILLCRPLHAHYHNMIDDREHKAHPHIGIFELAERLINELLDQPPFIAREIDILNTIKAKIDDLPKKQESELTAQPTNAPQQNVVQPTLVIPAISILSVLPSSIQALEHLLMRYVLDGSVSQDLRVKLRTIVQSLVAIYPQAMIIEAARQETSRLADVSRQRNLEHAQRAENHLHPAGPKLTD